MNLTHSTDLPARTADALAAPADFELRFGSLFSEGRGLSFPCDASGKVEQARLSHRARLNYLRALAVGGREYGVPSVRRCSKD